MALISHYPLNGDLRDRVGTRHGSGSGVAWVTGIFGQAARMDAGVMSFPTPIARHYSLAFWIRLRSDRNGETGIPYRQFMSKGDGSTQRSPTFWFGNTNNRLHMRQGVGDNYNAGIDTGSYELTPGEWYHVVFTCEPKRDGLTHIYTIVNGTRFQKDTEVGLPTVFGSSLDFKTELYDVMDVRVYDHALSKREIAEVAKGRMVSINVAAVARDLDDVVAVTDSGITYEYDDILKRRVAVFDGTAKWTLPNPFGQIGTDQVWTVEALIYRTDLAGEQYFVAGMNNGLKISHVNNLAPLLYLNGGANDYYMYGDRTKLPAGRWIHLVFAFDNVTGYRAIYADGKDISTGGPNNTSTPGGIQSTLNIGYGFKGKMAFVKMYATAFTAAEVADRFQKIMAVDERGSLQVGLRRLVESGQTRNPIIDYSVWKDDGLFGGVAPFGSNGIASKNRRVTDVGPFGEDAVVWQAMNTDTASTADGGWNSYAFPVDNTKRYRFAVWMRRKVMGNGTAYWGLHGYGSLDGVIQVPGGTGRNTNPYFVYTATAIGAEWQLYVGFVHPHDYDGDLHEDNGIYDLQGNRVATILDFKWLPETLTANHRAYLYYSSDTSTIQQFAYPRIDVCDGSEPSIEQLLAGFDLNWVNSDFAKPLDVRDTQLSLGRVSEFGIARGLLHAYPFEFDYLDRCSQRVAVPTASELGPEGVILDGTAYLDLGELDAFGDEWTVMCRYTPSGLDMYTHFLTASPQTDFAFKAGINANNTRPYFYTSATAAKIFSTELVVGQTYHIAMTYKDGVLRQYLNGVLDNQHAVTIAPIPKQTYRVGNWNAEFSEGVERDLRVYTRALTSEEVRWQAQWSKRQSGVLKTPAGLLLSNQLLQTE